MCKAGIAEPLLLSNSRGVESSRNTNTKKNTNTKTKIANTKVLANSCGIKSAGWQIGQYADYFTLDWQQSNKIYARVKRKLKVGLNVT